MAKGKQTRSVPVREGYDLWSSTYDSTPNPVVALDARHSLALLGPRPGERILDAGCGTGRNLPALHAAGAMGIGIDFSSGMLSVARGRLECSRVALADLMRPLPFRDMAFDAVLCTLIGEHLPKLDFTLGEFHRVLRPGGRLAFTVYHPELALAGVEANFDHHGIEHRLGAVLHTRDDYVRFASEAGFESLAVRDIAGDDKLARQLPKAASLLGRHVLLAITARRGNPRGR